MNIGRVLILSFRDIERRLYKECLVDFFYDLYNILKSSEISKTANIYRKRSIKTGLSRFRLDELPACRL